MAWIEGTVTEAEGGHPIPSVEVRIDGATNVVVPTDARGKFKVRVLYGPYVVTAGSDGYIPQHEVIRTLPLIIATANFALRREAEGHGDH